MFYTVFVSDGIYNSPGMAFVQTFDDREAAKGHAYEMSKETGLITYVYMEWSEGPTLVESFSGPCGDDVSNEVAAENIEDDD